MSDSFDPDAWPSAGGNDRKGGSNDRANKSSYDDPYDTFDFDDDVSTTGGSKVSSSTDDDFNFNFDDFGDEPTQSQRQAPVAAPRRTNDRTDDPYGDDPYGDDPYGDDPYGDKPSAGGFDSGFDDDYDNFGATRNSGDAKDRGRSNDGYDDYDDDYDQYDREPASGGDNKRKLIGIFAIGFLILAVVGIAVTFLGSDDGNQATPPASAPQTGTVQDSPATTAAPAAPAAPAELPAAVVESVNQGLASWGRFAINGDISEVQPYFVQDGPQYARFETEASDIRNRAIGGPAMQMTMSNPIGEQVGADWIVRGTVTVARDGEEPQSFPWELRMTQQSERSPWQILTVRQT